MAKAGEGVLLNISEMIDLAIGTPEIGVVDFCMLQTVLHCLAQQMRILDKNVELRGSIAVLPVGRQPVDAQTIAVNELLLETDGQPAEPEDQDTLLIVERVAKEGRGPTSGQAATGKGPGGTPGGPGGAPPASGLVSKSGKLRGRSKTGHGTLTSKEADAGAGAGAAAKAGTGPGGGAGGGAGTVAGTGGQAGGGAGGTTGGATGGAAHGTAGGAAGGAAGGGAVGEAGGGAGGGAGGTAGGAEGGTGGKAGSGAGGRAGGGAGVGGSPDSSITSTSKTAHGVSSYEKLSLVTLSKFNLLEDAVEDLKNRVYGSIPKNEEILEEVRSQTNLKAITDMWTNLNVSSRLEAAEEAISKLSSLLQDVIGETAEIQKMQQSQAVDGGKTKPDSTPSRMTDWQVSGDKSTTGEESRMIPPAEMTAPSGNIMFSPSTEDGGGPVTSSQFVNVDALASRDELLQILEMLQALKDEHEWLVNAFTKAMKDMSVDIEKMSPRPPMPPPPSSLLSQAPSGGGAGAGAGAGGGAGLGAGGKAGAGGKGAGGGPGPGAGAGSGAEAKGGARAFIGADALEDPAMAKLLLNSLEEKLNELEVKMQLCNDVIFTRDGNLQEQVESLQNQVDHLQRQAPLQPPTEPGIGRIPTDIATDLQALMQLFQTVQAMQGQLQQVHETAVQLATEKEDRQHNINSLLEQIELLKSIKLDREDMVEALADKADLRMLARKVSHDQFEMACDDLSRGLEHALGKLNVQESLWQQALDDIQREIEAKLDKVELSPVKEFFNNKLKQLQENLKKMAELRREAQAAGTKRRLLRDVNCISCDAQAVMAMEEAGVVPTKPLPPSLSMKPYLSYELDAIRKAQASGLPQRNMHDWENVTKQMTTPRQPQKVRSETDKHICNRYCGGSHTTTTPAQRVARLGHFVKQWGPEVLPLSSAYATGDDGRLYKVTATEGVAVGPGGATDAPCTPKSPIKKEGRHVSKTPKPPGVSPECRCLEERPPKP